MADAGVVMMPVPTSVVELCVFGLVTKVSSIQY